jgi:hypothetical protein
MPTMTKEDVIGAVIEAVKRFTKGKEGGFKQNFDAGDVNILFNRSTSRGGEDLWNCGAPPKYTIDKRTLQGLINWWNSNELDLPGTPKALAQQYKEGLNEYQVNFQLRDSANNRLFNFHASVDLPVSEILGLRGIEANYRPDFDPIKEKWGYEDPTYIDPGKAKLA